LVDGDNPHDNVVTDCDYVLHTFHAVTGVQLRDVNEAAMAGKIDERAVPFQPDTPTEGFGADARQLAPADVRRARCRSCVGVDEWLAIIRVA
jgi:hypothetical protein